MTTAFVLSGGGSLGAVQVGMLRSFAERGWAPDLLIGASAGALNAAFLAARPFTTDSVYELTHHLFALAVAAFHDEVELIVLPPLCPLAVSSVDFSRAAQLIERARRSTHEWIEAGGPARPHPERFLALHAHGDPSVTAVDATGGHAA